MPSFLKIILLIGLSLSAQAQRSIIKDVDAGGLQELAIDIKNISRLTVKAIDTDRFKAYMDTEGEFAPDLVLNLVQTNSTWSMNVDFAPGITPEDDKLAAHKVIAAELTLEIPKGKYLTVFGRCLGVNLNGFFQFVELKLGAGNITTKEFLANGVLSTANGDINVKGQKGLYGNAEGNPDKIQNELPQSGSFKIRAVSPEGNIYLKAKN